jgi:hypothetical protein
MFTRKQVMVIATMIAVFFLTALLLWLFVGKDDPPVDADLVPDATTIKDEDNGYHALKDALANLDLPEDLKQQMGRFDVRTNWNAEVAADILSRNATVLKAYQDALQRPKIRLPPAPTPPGIEKELGTIRTLSQFGKLKATSLFYAGKEFEAFRVAMDNVRFGQRFEQDADSIMRLLVGRAIKTTGVHQMRRFASLTSLPNTSLRTLIAELAAYEADASVLTNALKGEYQFFKRGVDDIATGKAQGLPPWQQLGARFALKPLFRPRQTKALMADLTREWLSVSSNHGNEMNLTDDPVFGTNQPSTFRLILQGNAAGRAVVRMSALSTQSMLFRKCRENNDLHATRLLLALRCYHNDHGTLPESLDALVPAYLDRVPLDDYDGQPFRYSRGNKRLYSVGENFRDDGGVERDVRGERLDDVYPIEF